MKSKITKLIFFVFVAIVLFSCTKEETPVSIIGIKTSSARLLVNVGETDTIKVVFNPLNADNKDVSWSSSNTAIATVSSLGLVTGITPGTAIIRVSSVDGNKTDSCVVSVLKWTTYNTVNSVLAHDYVSSIIIDANGNKWIGTWGGGVSKFDDTNWITYNTSNSNLSNDMVLTIAIDNLGAMWFGTLLGGVSKFNGGAWSTYQTNGSVWAIGIDANSFQWWGTSSSLLKFDGANLDAYTIINSNYVLSISIDNLGNKWIGTNENGVLKFDGINWTTYNTSNSGLANNSIRAIAVDAQNNKWFCTWGNGVSKFNDTNWTNYKRDDGLVCDSVVSIAIDSQGNKWFGTWKGVSKFDGTNWTNYKRKNGLACDTVSSIAIDAQNNKWFGTWNGVSKLQD